MRLSLINTSLGIKLRFRLAPILVILVMGIYSKNEKFFVKGVQILKSQTISPGTLQFLMGVVQQLLFSPGGSTVSVIIPIIKTQIDQ